jgi:hypothetical protein
MSFLFRVRNIFIGVDGHGSRFVASGQILLGQRGRERKNAWSRETVCLFHALCHCGETIWTCLLWNFIGRGGTHDKHHCQSHAASIDCFDFQQQRLCSQRALWICPFGVAALLCLVRPKRTSRHWCSVTNTSDIVDNHANVTGSWCSFSLTSLFCMST